MNNDQGANEKSGKESNDIAENEPIENKSTYAGHMNSTLNYIFQESWWGYIVCGLAITGLIYCVGSYFTVKPIWIGCISTMVLADIFIFAAFHSINARWLKDHAPATNFSTRPSNKATKELSEIVQAVVSKPIAAKNPTIWVSAFSNGQVWNGSAYVNWTEYAEVAGAISAAPLKVGSQKFLATISIAIMSANPELNWHVQTGDSPATTDNVVWVTPSA